jgi:flagellin-specific chaperone FliS
MSNEIYPNIKEYLDELYDFLDRSLNRIEIPKTISKLERELMDLIINLGLRINLILEKIENFNNNDLRIKK